MDSRKRREGWFLFPNDLGNVHLCLEAHDVSLNTLKIIGVWSRVSSEEERFVKVKSCMNGEGLLVNQKSNVLR